MRFRAMGDGAVLAELERPGESLALALALQRDPLDGVLDVVPAEVRVLVAFDPGRVRGGDVVRWVQSARPESLAGAGFGVVELEVRYDGDDLEEVARLTGLSESEVVAAHTGAEWLVAFSGFAPGFGYLRPVSGTRLEVPRRDEPRTRVPAGSVALAAGYSGVYPRVSPGGWQLIGHTDAVLWNPGGDPPALLRPGTRVRFRQVSSRVQVGAEGTRTAAVEDSDSRPGPGRPSLLVLRAGPMTTVQDLGRPGWAHLGVPGSGAADRGSLRLANRLVGNRESAAGLEVTVGGLVLRAVRDLTVAVTGASGPLTIERRGTDEVSGGGKRPVGDRGSGRGASVGARPAPRRALLDLRDGEVLSFGPAASGVRSYLAVRGGVDAAAALGSRSADLLSGLGPDRLRDGDALDVGDETDGWPVTELAPGADPPSGVVILTAIAGPHDHVLTPAGRAALETTTWQVDDRSDRVGVRLAGPALDVRTVAAMPSEPMVRGAVQLPPGGQPVVFLADHPVTGGYPVIAVLPLAEVDRAAQVRPGQPLRLALQPAPEFG